MRLLIFTQVVDKNDPILGFFHNWILKLSKKVESVVVICLFKGEYYLPENVKVLSLGKEEGESRIKYIFRFYKYIFKYRSQYDTVFVHMNQIYVILGSFVWLATRKKIFLWYAHGSVSLSLKVAERLVTKIFTSSKKGLRMETPKREVMGQGIDTNYFVKGGALKDGNILSLGRLSETKNIHIFIEAINILKDKMPGVKAVIVGNYITEKDKTYTNDLHDLVKKHSLEENITFVGGISPDKILPFYQDAGVFVNLSQTGSMDKTVLEAMSCEVSVVTSNEAYVGEDFYVVETTFDPREVADGILQAMKMDGSKGREQVIKDHSIENLMTKIVYVMEKNA